MAVTDPVLPPPLAVVNAVDTRLVTVKAPVVKPAAMVATRGTTAPGRLMLKAMVAPPAGAGPLRVIVQVLVPGVGRTVGLHCTEETTTAAERLKFALRDARRRMP